MEIKTRLLRQPWLTALWTLALAAAFGLLLTGAGLLRAAWLTQNQLEQQYTSVLLPADVTQNPALSQFTNQAAFTEEELEQVSQIPGVLLVDRRTVSAGYNPDFQPASSLEVDGAYDLNWEQPYNQILVEATVLDSSFETQEVPAMEWSGYSQPAYENGILRAHIEVEQVLRAHPSYEIPSSLEVYWSIFEPDDSMRLEPGRRYLLYGSFFSGDAWFKTQQSTLVALRDQQSTTASTLTLDDGVTAGSQLQEDGSYRFYFRADQTVQSPTFALLEGSAEDFLNAPQNQLWRDTLEYWEITQHCLPVIGTNKLESIYDFNQQEAAIAEGRSFTPEEYEQGAKVCILSQQLAQTSGIQVGDTISISQYSSSIVPPTQQANNPTILPYTPDNDFVSQEDFVVVGLYRQNQWWKNSAYSFTPNAVFIPQKSQIQGYSPTGGFYLSVVVENGKLEQVVQQLQSLGMGDRFLPFDQGYQEAVKAMEQLVPSAGRLAAIAAAGWAVVLALYLVLWQGRQKRQLGVMRSLGASRRRARRYLLGSGLAPAALGALLGWGASVALAGQVDRLLLQTTAGLEQTSHSAGAAQLPLLAQSGSAGWMALAALAALALAGLVLWAQAALLAGKKPRDLVR